MDRESAPCKLCRPINLLCFWGEMPVRPWKRPALLVASSSIVLLFGVLAWYAKPGQDVGEHIAVALGIGVGSIGAVVAVFACNKCVARLFGSV